MTHSNARKHAEQFLALSGEFRLGGLVTEQSHTCTRSLSETARVSVTDALDKLFEVDDDVLTTYRDWISTDAPERISGVVTDALLSGGRVFFTGCGATGRLSILLESAWRKFWGGRPSGTHHSSFITHHFADSVLSVMAGGDYALIKSVEGFEDFARFGEKQIEDMDVSAGDVVFAITEGGETSFVIGTAWKALEKGAKVYFVYNNPDDVLRETVARSREILDEPRIEKINLTTGPMAIMGSTRMQATSIQLCAMLTILEMAAGRLVVREDMKAERHRPRPSTGMSIPQTFLDGLEGLLAGLRSERVRRDLAGLVYLEETVYRLGRKSTYFADHLAIDVLTDTTERSPTFCIPPFPKWDDPAASDSWAFLRLPCPDSEQAWNGMLGRSPRCVAWSAGEICDMVGPERAEAQSRIVSQIGSEEILRFRIGLDGLASRRIEPGDVAVGVVSEAEIDSLTSPDGFYRRQLETASRSGAMVSLIFIGRQSVFEDLQEFLLDWDVRCRSLLLPLPETGLMLDGITRVGVKMLLNALSTCTMVRLGRVLGNTMVAVVPSNLKLIDRSARYVETLTDLSYEESVCRLFESIEYVRPRMETGRSYPPVVALTVACLQNGVSHAEAESRIAEEQSSW